MHYYVYRLNPDNVWIRITSSGPTSYNDAKAIERSYKSDGYIVRLFSASQANTIQYSPDN